MHKRVFNRRISQLGVLTIPAIAFSGTEMVPDTPVEIHVTNNGLVVVPAQCGCKNLLALVQLISDDEGAFCTATRNSHMIGFAVEQTERGCECTRCYRIVCDQCQATCTVEATEEM